MRATGLRWRRTPPTNTPLPESCACAAWGASNPACSRSNATLPPLWPCSGITWMTKDGLKKPNYFGSLTHAATVRARGGLGPHAQLRKRWSLRSTKQLGLQVQACGPRFRLSNRSMLSTRSLRVGALLEHASRPLDPPCPAGAGWQLQGRGGARPLLLPAAHGAPQRLCAGRLGHLR